MADGIGGALVNLLGGPDPRQQLYQQLGQTPGQPGSPAGPQPLAPGPGGGAPASPPAAGAPPGSPSGGPGGPQQPPQPQAYTSPPDLAQLYMQMTQRDQQAAGINRGLGALFSAMAKPVNKQAMLGAFGGGEENTGAMFNNLMQLQSYQAQQQRYADLVNNAPAYAKSFNVDPDMFKAMIVAAGPQGAGDVLGKVAEAQMGLTGSQTDKEYKQVMRTWGSTPDQQDAQGNPLPRPSEAAWEQNQRDIATANKQKTTDLTVDKGNFQNALQAYDQKIGLIDQLNTPAMQAGLKEFLGTTGSIRPVALMDKNGKDAWALYTQVMAGQFAEGVQDLHGAGRITQSELQQDAPSKSTMGKLNQDPDTFISGMNAYRTTLANHRANLFGKAGYLNDPRLTDADYDNYVSGNYKPGGDYASSGPVNRTPATVQSPADIANLPHGKAFIIPGGPDKGKVDYAP